jgi:acylphosphatase
VYVRAHVYISGIVQGVFFRSSTVRLARELGLCGWVRNLPDGRVEAVFEGEEEAVKRAVEWCWKGPPDAIVEHVNVIYEPVEGEVDFAVRY